MKKISLIVLALFLGLCASLYFVALRRKSAQQSAPVAMEVDAEGNEVVADTLTQTTEDITPAPESLFEFDQEKKRKQVMDLVNRGVQLFKDKSLDEAMVEVSHTKEFIIGELYLFVIDLDGTVYAHREENLLWTNLIDQRDAYGISVGQVVLDQAKVGPGWVTYQWRNSTKITYVTQITKDGKSYVLGAGYYPHSKRDMVVNMVRGAVEHFNAVIKKGGGKEEAFSAFSYPLGRFVAGDLYLFALDFKGTLAAQGDRPGLIGQNSWDYQDSNGKYVNREIVKALENSTEGVWVDYLSKRARKNAYAERVVDPQGTPYFIACGYYPDVNRDSAVDLVKRGYEYMKGHGKTAASEAFTTRQSDDFRYGDLYLVVHSFDGTCVANGINPEYIGQNQLDEKDEDGRLYIKDMIKKAESGGGWIDFKIKNAFQTVYVEKVDLGIENYMISCGIFPISKRETMILLVKSGIGHLVSHDDADTFKEIMLPTGKFVRGDLKLFVLDETGICYAWANHPERIWENLSGLKDQDGKLFIKMFINAVQAGPTTVSYHYKGATKIAYLESVEKNGKRYIIGSNFDK